MFDPNKISIIADYNLVQGCDASVIIASPNGDAEKDSSDNLSLAGDGFDTVVKAKQAVEAVCPGVVSCADILAIAARDVVVLVTKTYPSLPFLCVPIYFQQPKTNNLNCQ